MAAAWLHGSKYRLRVPRSDRRLVAVSTGSSDKRTVRALERMVESLRDRGEFDVLDAIADGRKTLLQVYAEYRSDVELSDVKVELDDMDIEPLVETWHAAIRQRHPETAAKYLAQVRRLIPAGAPFPKSRFRRKVISEHLAGLVDLQSSADEKPPVSSSTRNRHRAALSQFGRWLVEREVLETNVVRDVRAQRENAARAAVYAPSDVRRLVEAMPLEYRALAALLAGTGVEMQVAKRLRRRDVDLDAWTVQASGSKTAWRNRTVAVTEGWTRPFIEGHVTGLLPNALLFPELDHNLALDAHHAACQALGLPRSTLHDHRHHYAVTLRRRGVSDVVIAHQLGHGSTMLVATRYGRYQPEVAEVTRAAGGTTQAQPKKRAKPGK